MGVEVHEGVRIAQTSFPLDSQRIIPMVPRMLHRWNMMGNERDAGSLEVGVEWLQNDTDAEEGLGGWPAACVWLDKQTGMDRRSMCEAEHRHNRHSTDVY